MLACCGVPRRTRPAPPSRASRCWRRSGSTPASDWRPAARPAHVHRRHARLVPGAGRGGRAAPDERRAGALAGPAGGRARQPARGAGLVPGAVGRADDRAAPGRRAALLLVLPRLPGRGAPLAGRGVGAAGDGRAGRRCARRRSTPPASWPGRRATRPRPGRCWRRATPSSRRPATRRAGAGAPQPRHDTGPARRRAGGAGGLRARRRARPGGGRPVDAGAGARPVGRRALADRRPGGGARAAGRGGRALRGAGRPVGTGRRSASLGAAWPRRRWGDDAAAEAACAEIVTAFRSPWRTRWAGPGGRCARATCGCGGATLTGGAGGVWPRAWRRRATWGTPPSRCWALVGCAAAAALDEAGRGGGAAPVSRGAGARRAAWHRRRHQYSGAGKLRACAG